MRGLQFPLLLFLNILVLPNSMLTTAQQESQPQAGCNSCCQGPVGSPGTPGIPGVPGTSGIPGSLGPKGDSIKGDKGDSIKGDKGDSIKGDTGSHGEKGDTGSPGLKGERGMVGLGGPPGKIGPGGISGPAGPPGVSGVKGQKGEMGQSRVSAFSAVRSTSFTPSSANLALPFEQVYTNVGNDFNSATGQFTCEIPGIYLFTYHIMSHTDVIYVNLVKNDNAINSVYKADDERHDMVSNTAVLQLAVGDQVWLRCPYAAKKIYSDSSLYTSFSGVILHEI